MAWLLAGYVEGPVAAGKADRAATGALSSCALLPLFCLPRLMLCGGFSILHDGKSEAVKNRMMHKCSTGAAKRKEPEARGAVGSLMSQAVDQSSNAQQAP